MKHGLATLRRALVFTFVTATINIYGQWSGTYHGILNGDQVTMVLTQNHNSIQGTLKDSYQTYTINGEVNNNRMAADAVEQSIGLTFALLAERMGDELSCRLVINLMGTQSETPFTVRKNNAVNSTPDSQKQASSSSKDLPSTASHPTILVGKWTKHETYNSGYGSNFMGGNFSQSMHFYADGTLGDGGSSASMSGTNYYGSSSGEGSGKIAGLLWYVIGNDLYLSITDQGRTQQAKLGRWYVENNHLLITAENGEKLLLSRN